MSDYWQTFLGMDLAAIDPDVARLIALEEERQARRIILIPSESIAPAPVRAALGSVFNNIYAEGYPALRMLRDDEELLTDYEHQLAYYRRYGDRRFYKGAEFVDILESLACRRVAMAYANERVPAENLYANVQPLSGAAANLAVYDAIMKPGDTLMGMDLYQGGHLTHGSRFNISGKRYNVASYGVDRQGRLDYDAIMAQALQARPKVIVAGFTSYPWAPDWAKFRAIADACGAYLMADIAHCAGLAIAGAYPSPVGYADVITFTTHKTICGPRGACILTDKESLAQKIASAVFPGAQGGPHPNKFAAMAVAFHIAMTDEYRRLMFRITENAQALAQALQRRGLTLAYGGTDTHLLMLDLRPIKAPGGEPLRGEAAVRIMEEAGIVANKNTIPGDTVTALGSGVRMGTPWVTQRGMGPAEMDIIADCVHRLLTNIRPFQYIGAANPIPRGKIDIAVLEEVRRDVLNLTARAATDVPAPSHPRPCPQAAEAKPGRQPILITSRRARSFIREACTADLCRLEPGEWARTLMLDKAGRVLDDLYVIQLTPDVRGRERLALMVNPSACARVTAWLEGLSDGYVVFDEDDIYAKVEGPVVISDLSRAGCDTQVLEAVAAFEKNLPNLPPPIPAGTEALAAYRAEPGLFCLSKPYFVGQAALRSVLPAGDKPSFVWQPPAEPPLQRTPLYEEHRKLTRQIIPFAGWEMPVWYTSVTEEHRAVREAAGLFDVAHMGVFEVSGPNATAFLDAVSSNYAGWLQPGQSHYSYLLDPDGNVIDDIMVYYVERGRYLMVVNAANAEKDWAWLNAVNDGAVLIDRDNPLMRVQSRTELRDLKDPRWGSDCRVDIALQGPASRRTLQALADGPDRSNTSAVKDALNRLRRTEVMKATLAGLDLIIARTGYTGEDVAYEIFVHPDQAVTLWHAILEAGAPYGVKPCGLAARDSTRTEAGLPLYGHELAGPLNITPHEAGFPSYVKFHKPFFIGRRALMEKARASTRKLVRFQVNEPGQRAIRGFGGSHDGEHGETVVNRRGAYIGRVTSCALVGETQVGMALVDARSAEEGTPIAIYPMVSGRQPTLKAPSELGPGDTVQLPVWATVISRFPPKAGKGPTDGGSD